MQTPLKFVHVGYGYVINANMIVAVMPPNSMPTIRMARWAKTNGSYLDMTRGNETKSYLLTTDGTVVALGFNPLTVYKRLNDDPAVKANAAIKKKKYPVEEIDDEHMDEYEDVRVIVDTSKREEEPEDDTEES